MEIKNIVSNGFSLNELEKRISSFAFISLRTALKSYFSTYKSSKFFISTVLNGNSMTQIEKDWQYGNEYIEDYSETIIHLQHFFELICKEILREKHELLVLNIDNKHELFYNLLFKEKVSSSDLEGLRTSEFKSTFERMCQLIRIGKLDTKFNFFNEPKNKVALEQLNLLRNRIWHRGTYVLRYEALDLFIGKYLLPLIINVVELPEYKNLENRWKYNTVNSQIDPITEIISECSNANFNIGKIAFLKELGRAAYNNPLDYKFKIFNDEIINRSKRIAEAEVHLEKYSQADRIYSCPVCGVNSLTSYIDSDGDMEEDGTYSSYWTCSWYIKCYCCSFEISSELKNPKDYGYNLPDYWYCL
ncbi:hypothetical protein [Gottfriedia solisilvae]|uniref:Uncharacterized protein n=1 Tax=Gottfriedia solisilvae TaxID=1516104 RepID=A0A8J3AQX4_9BACI|nr:hypothetical protein [Gottfriedia solisilvae]GGI18490.1 hypothetical protein GCM10007380_43170 [Gottfriedia solisilvae]